MNSPTPRSGSTRTLAWGAAAVALVACALSFNEIPGTNISLAVPYAAEGPGPTVDTLGKVEGVEVVDVELGADTGGSTPRQVDVPSGQLNMTTVSVRTNMSFMQLMSRWIGARDTIVPISAIIPQDKTEEEVMEANQIAFSQSESAATVAAMDYLGIPVRIKVAAVMDDSAAQGVVEEGDVLVAVDGTAVTQPQQAQKIIRDKKPGDTVELTYRRGEQELKSSVVLKAHPQDDSVPLLGVFMSAEPDTDIKVTYNLQDIGGPSAGMMFSLAVIDKLSPGDLTGNHFVAGTGTIAEDGTVGSIGGIVHKVKAAKDAGAELFLAPADNCAEAISRDTGDMVVAKVNTISDSIKAMEDFAAGREVTTCAG